MPLWRLERVGPLKPLVLISSGSDETIAESINAQSSDVHARGPTQSIDGESGRSPRRLTKLFVGFKPATPHQAAGSPMELAVSVPTDPGQRRADLVLFALRSGDVDEPVGGR